MTFIRLDRVGRVYFIKPIGMDGPVKIGFSVLPAGRLDQLTVWSPFPLEIAATAPGTRKLEQKLHTYFRQSHSHREWFTSTPEMRRVITAIAAGHSLNDLIDLDAVVPQALARLWTPEHSLRRSYYSRIYHATNRIGLSSAPHPIRTIMDRWSGCHGQKRRSPDEVEIETLERFIAEPDQFVAASRQFRDHAGAMA